jgi:hypothetical protein
LSLRRREAAGQSEPVEQFYCHCDDCQAATSGPYVAVAIFPADAVTAQGRLETWTIRTLHRKRCAVCATRLFAEVPDFEQRGVNALLLPEGMFKPEFHINCRYAVLPVNDDLPHFKGFPAKFGGSDETIDW